MSVSKTIFLLIFSVFFVSLAQAEDGYRLWLRYEKLPEPQTKIYLAKIKSLFFYRGDSSTIAAARNELKTGLEGLLGKEIALDKREIKDGAVVVGKPRDLPKNYQPKISDLHNDSYAIRSLKINGKRITLITAYTDIGLLYGSFHLLRLIQTGQSIDDLDIFEKPKIKLRLLNHWDNLDGSIERGYAGKSLWKWDKLLNSPDVKDRRLKDYARANASIGINGSVLNNVNANAQILTGENLKKVAAIAETFRPYGIKVYLSARFSAPMEIGGLKTADPFDANVKHWWKAKADEIYKLIPDFGGFLVKANSEGQPGPRTYNRSHTDGANMLAEALAPHRGVVIWRAFVYDMKPGYDRAGAAFGEFRPLDGKFAANVLLQVKNGPVDFQPREPFHPLFGAMPKTNVMPELQITQEYLGFSNHLVFLVPMWKEVLEADTFAGGRNSTVARVADGSLFDRKLTGIAGVANTGSDRNWTGHHFSQANWYAFGRLAWDHEISSKKIADEWTKMTFTYEPHAAGKIKKILLGSHEAAVSYMTPLGLHHQIWGGHHYGPAPWWDIYERADWNPTYYNKAARDGIGFDRTKKGSNSVRQYSPQVREKFSDLNKIPEKYLLWFHHVSWDHKMRSGRTLWKELTFKYQSGVDWVRKTNNIWHGLKDEIDEERFNAVSRKLAIQERDAVWWKDASLSYFQTFSELPIPAGVEKPKRTLEEYKTIDLLDDFARGKGTFDEDHQ